MPKKKKPDPWHRSPNLIPFLSLVFAAGVTFDGYTNLNHRVDEIHEKVAYHQDQKNHPDNTNRVDMVELRLERIESSLMDLTKSNAESSRKLDQLCIASPDCTLSK